MKYHIEIVWDDSDGCCIADIPELPGCMAHGVTYDEALIHAKEAMQLWLDTANEFGDLIPEPKGERLGVA